MDRETIIMNNTFTLSYQVSFAFPYSTLSLLYSLLLSAPNLYVKIKILSIASNVLQLRQGLLLSRLTILRDTLIVSGVVEAAVHEHMKCNLQNHIQTVFNQVK